MLKSGPIVVVEDDADDQELLNEIFTDLQISNLRFFDSCFLAFDYLSTTIETPFLIISDVNLPAMSGLELCRKIRHHKFLKTRNIPFVFLTTSNDDSLVKQAHEMFVHGFFVKPSTVKELREMVLKIVDYWRICRIP